METPFAAYQGDESYVFVCYAHEDADVVYPEIMRLHGSGLNIWYDEGISPGHEWTQELADAIENSTQVLYFVSPSSVASRHCRNEVQYALEQEKALVTVYLEPTELPGGACHSERFPPKRMEIAKRSPVAIRDRLSTRLQQSTTVAPPGR